MFECPADRAVEEADQRPQAAAGRAPAEQVSVEADRRQSLDQRRRHCRERDYRGTEQQRPDQVLPPRRASYFLRSGLPCASFRPSVAIRMTSISHQMPHPPAVSSFTTPSPM